MKWEKVAQRENDFLKNCLVYEAFVDNFVRVFGISHPDFLTTRKGQSYKHYISKESYAELAEFLIEQIRKNPDFMEGIYNKGKEHFDNLLNFCSNLEDLKNKTNEQLIEEIKEYFRLYKEPYPYFMITVDARPLEKEAEKYNKAIKTMAKLRLEGRAGFNKTHEIGYPLFKEIAERLNISVNELKFLKPSEAVSLLKGNELNISELIKDREHCFFVHSDRKSMLHECALLNIHSDKQETDEIKGRGTFPAKYKGKVRLIKTKEDMKELKLGEVMVLKMTTTDLIIEGIEKAGAIITNEGGITCHAAIVSREFNIPALMGTRNATKLLKTGDIVEIDTEKGIAKKIKCPQQ